MSKPAEHDAVDNATNARIDRLERIVANTIDMLIRHGVVLVTSPYYDNILTDIEAIKSELQTSRDAGC